jgi:uncharacterized protein YhhL (DUF1145 family)
MSEPRKKKKKKKNCTVLVLFHHYHPKLNITLIIKKIGMSYCHTVLIPILKTNYQARQSNTTLKDVNTHEAACFG